MATTRVFSQNSAPNAGVITRLYTAPTSGFTVVSQITVYNGSGGIGSFKVYVGDFAQISGISGATPSAGTQRWGPLANSIQAAATIVLSGRIVVSNGGWIDVFGAQPGWTFAMDAVEVTDS